MCSCACVRVCMLVRVRACVCVCVFVCACVLQQWPPMTLRERHSPSIAIVSLVIYLLTEARHVSKVLEIVIISGTKPLLGPACSTDSISLKSRNHQVKLSITTLI